jgi:hypothetical protein
MRVLWTVILFLQASVATFPAGSVSGRLLSLDGTPEIGVRMALMAAFPEGATRAALLSLSQTDGSGRYTLERVPPGQYYIVAGPLDSPSYYPGRPVPTGAEIVAIVAGAAVQLPDFTLVQPGGIQRMRLSATRGTLRGALTDGTAAPIVNIIVVLTSSAQSGNRFLTATNRAGAFEFSNLTAGEYVLEAFSPVHSGYRSQGYERFRHSITIRADQGIDLEIRLRLAMDSASQRRRPDAYGPVSEGETGGRQISISANALTLTSGELLVDPRSAASREDEIDVEVTFEDTGRLRSVRIVDANADPELVRRAVKRIGGWHLAIAPGRFVDFDTLRTTVALFPLQKD